MEWHFAEALETIAAAIPDEIALVCGDVRRTWREYEDRAARLAGVLVDAGLKPDAKVGIYGYNSNEWLEAQFAIFKMRGVSVNVNYRYTPDELVYLLDYADAEAVIFDAEFAAQVAAIKPRLPKLKAFIQIADGSGQSLPGALDFETAIAGHAPLPRQAYSPDDIYMLFTGGTTGMPKGVMYRHGEFAQQQLMGYGVYGLPVPASLEDLRRTVLEHRDAGTAPAALAACPLMHGVGLWAGCFMTQMVGGRAVTMRDARFDAAALWRTAVREKVRLIAIVGDAFARPMLQALDAARDAGKPYDLSALKIVFSSGVMFSREVKQGLLAHADIKIWDSMGASEGGMGNTIATRDQPPSQTAAFNRSPTTRVFAEDGREIEPGSDEIGMVGNGGRVPIGYYKDPEKSAATFRVVNGHRYSFAGDFAKVAADGSLILMGRGSVCINTGGEKVFPEEVEEALKAHLDVEDALVVGVPDARFGERVVAVVSPVAGRALDIADLVAFARGRVAGYKVPREVILVSAVQRAANGKADYKWAKAFALAEVKGVSA